MRLTTERTHSDAGTWLLEIGGVGANDFDRLAVTDIAVLDGTLELSLVNGYAPTLRQTLNILLAPGGVTGTFDDVLQPATLPSGLTFDVLYGTTLVQLMVVSAPTFSADFNDDGSVNGDDLSNWKSGFGTNTAATHAQGDADADHDADGADFLAWRRQLGSGPAVLPANASVPEPATLMLLFMGTLARHCRPRRIVS